ncbi:MAG: ABC transporter ATP-binding protein [Candidatus Hydrogenedentes bacterium]|nr:ABC transporter ATP-binding protein [Candidatus Hydrogenedentota bacterium]
MTQPILSVRNLRVRFKSDKGEAWVVDDVSLDVSAGKTLALVGESGCGKSMTALSILRLIPSPPGKIASGEILLGGRDLLALPETDMQAIRGAEISMIFQEPMTSLHPVFRAGNQIAAAIMLHSELSFAEARRETVQLLAQVGIPSPEERADDYPHQMSGGMRQRAMIAMALSCKPSVLIADEPTTALDVTIQAQILDLLKKLQEQLGMAIILITHDLGIVAENADEVAIMYAGKIVERAPVQDLYSSPRHPYTVGLFNSLPKLNAQRARLVPIPGQVPAATEFPAGCRFHPRCAHAMSCCTKEVPKTLDAGAGHSVACWLYDTSTMSVQGRPVGIPAAEAAKR